MKLVAIMLSLLFAKTLFADYSCLTEQEKDRTRKAYQCCDALLTGSENFTMTSVEVTKRERVSQNEFRITTKMTGYIELRGMRLPREFIQTYIVEAECEKDVRGFGYYLSAIGGWLAFAGLTLVLVLHGG